MSISVTSLKRLCRRHGVKRWPHRQLNGLNRAVSHLEAKKKTSSDDPSIDRQLSQLYSRRDLVIDVSFSLLFYSTTMSLVQDFGTTSPLHSGYCNTKLVEAVIH